MTRSLLLVPMMERYTLQIYCLGSAMLTHSCSQVFVWKVPEDFTLHTDADEPTDVSPVHKLSGHTRYAALFVFLPVLQANP